MCYRSMRCIDHVWTARDDLYGSNPRHSPRLRGRIKDDEAEADLEPRLDGRLMS
jgi:hypothetical protein